MNEFQLLKQRIPGVRKDVLLKDYTTFRIGGPAKYFFVARTNEDIEKAVKAARKLNLPFFLLGGGSNLLVSNKGFPGFVIKIENCKLKIENSLVYAEAGVDFPVLVRETGKLGLAGLEWAGGLPGTVGGAVRGNAGAFGGEVKDTVKEVELLDGSGEITRFNVAQCRFSYRSSVFKEKNFVVLYATLELHKGERETIEAVAQDHIRYRKERHPLEFPNAGSIFKNVDLKKFPKKFLSRVRHVIKTDPFPLVPTAYLISEAGLKGLRIGDAQVSEKHPNYIVNRGKARSNDVLALAEKVKKTIRKKFSVELETEIEYVASYPH